MRGLKDIYFQRLLAFLLYIMSIISAPSVPFAATVAVLICSSSPFVFPFSSLLLSPCPSVPFAATVSQCSSLPSSQNPYCNPRFCNSQLSFSLYNSPKFPQKSIFLKNFPKNILSEWFLVLILHSLTKTKRLAQRSLKDFHKLFVEKYKKQTLQRK